MIDLTKVLPDSFCASNHPHCDDVERGLCHIIVDGEKVLREKFDLKHLEDYDKIFTTADQETLNEVSLKDTDIISKIQETQLSMEILIKKIDLRYEITFWNKIENEYNSIIGLA